MRTASHAQRYSTLEKVPSTLQNRPSTPTAGISLKLFASCKVESLHSAATSDAELSALHLDRGLGAVGVERSSSSAIFQQRWRFEPVIGTTRLFRVIWLSGVVAVPFSRSEIFSIAQSVSRRYRAQNSDPECRERFFHATIGAPVAESLLDQTRAHRQNDFNDYNLGHNNAVIIGETSVSPLNAVRVGYLWTVSQGV